MSKIINVVLIAIVLFLGWNVYQNWGVAEKLFSAKEKINKITGRFDQLQGEHTFLTDEYNKAKVTINKQKTEPSVVSVIPGNNKYQYYP